MWTEAEQCEKRRWNGERGGILPTPAFAVKAFLLSSEAVPGRPDRLDMHDFRRKAQTREYSHSGSGCPRVSGAKGRTASPIRKTLHIVTPAQRIGSGLSAKTSLVSNPSADGPAAATKRPTL